MSKISQKNIEIDGKQRTIGDNTNVDGAVVVAVVGVVVVVVVVNGAARRLDRVELADEVAVVVNGVTDGKNDVELVVVNVGATVDVVGKTVDNGVENNDDGPV